MMSRHCLLCVIATGAVACCAAAFSANIKQNADYLPPRPLTDLGRDYKIVPVYFVPSDRKPASKYREKITVMMTFVADLYRRDLQAKQVKTRGLDFVFKRGRLEVRLVRGDRKAAFYSGEPNYSKNRLWNTVSTELVRKIGHPIRRIYLVITETHGPGPVGGRFPGENAESAPVHPHGGFVLVSGWMLHDEITGTSVRQHLRFLNDPRPVKNVKPGGQDRPRMTLAQGGTGVIAHELGHALFLLHDQGDTRNIMCFGYNQLRKSFSKSMSARQPVRFSDHHARMLARSRYLSPSFNEADGKSPEITFKITRTPQPGDREVPFTVEARDNAGLAAILYYESTLDSVVAGANIQGKSYAGSGVLSRPPLRPGQLLHYKVLAIDVNGNVGVSQVGVRIPSKKASREEKPPAK